MKLFNVTTNKEIEVKSLSKAFEIHEPFGSINIQQIVGDNWQIWFNRFEITETVELRLVADMSMIVMHIYRKNHFKYNWHGFHMPERKLSQFNLSFSPIIDMTGSFEGGQIYETAELMLQTEILQEYASDYPEVDGFLKSVALKQPAVLGGSNTSNHKMQQLLSDLVSFKCKPGVYLKNTKARLDIILTLALEELCIRRAETKLSMSADLKEKAYQAKEIIEQRLKNPPSIVELSRLCTSNSHSIQFAFKELFNMTIGEYSKEARMTLAKMLLLTGDHDLDSIADETGYYDGSSFSRYFKKIVGTTPGEFRKYGKSFE